MSSQIEEIKQRLDIVTLVQSYVPSLKHTGRNYFGLCPFHSEKSPSFSVNPELGIYKCFGCGEGGDVISFLQKVEGLDFRGALELAAEKAGVELVETTSPAQEKQKKQKERALQAHELAARYYHYLLMEHKSGEVGRKYALEKRQLTEKVLKDYQIGYAPKEYHNLQNFLLKKGFKQAELVDFGLLVSKNGRVYDKFRGRLLNPIFNLRGQVIGFSGRAVFPDDPGPKYLNSPETVTYHKKFELYGLFQAKDAIRQSRKVILVEGNIDILSSARVGVANIVCPLGTALTIEQLRVLKRYAEEVIFAFDTDNAGKKALLRSLELAESIGLRAKAVLLGDFKDVDELVCAEPKDWEKRVNSALEIPEFVIQIFKNDYDLSTGSDKAVYIKLCLSFIGKLRERIQVDHYLQKLELITGAKYDVLKEQLLRNPSEPVKAPTPSKEEAAAEELTPEEKPVIRVNRSLQSLLNYLYAYRETVSADGALRQIYSGSLAGKETTLIDTALGFEAKPEAKQVLTGIIADNTHSVDLNIPNPSKEITRMLKFYTKSRLRSYLRQARLQEPGNMEKISQYAKRIAELDR
jgi:DNA primase